MTTKIEWTNRTWNPIAGCSKVSAGCTNCYAIKQAFVRMHNPHPAIKQKFEGVAEKTKAGHLNWTGRINTDEETLHAPFKWKKPQRIFVNSMSDLFHEAVPVEFIDNVFAVISMTPRHTYQILTKRPERMLEYFSDAEATFIRIGKAAVKYMQSERLKPNFEINMHLEVPLPNVWLGVSVEDQETANKRIPLLLQTPAAVRFLSCEPLLGQIDLTHVEYYGSGTSFSHSNILYSINSLNNLITNNAPEQSPFPRGKIDWVIAGGESGSKARPVHPDWVRSLRDQCRVAKVPFFFKQWGEWTPYQYKVHDSAAHKGTFVNNDNDWGKYKKGAFIDCLEGLNWGTVMTRIGKFKAGRKLDGVEHNEYPI